MSECNEITSKYRIYFPKIIHSSITNLLREWINILNKKLSGDWSEGDENLVNEKLQEMEELIERLQNYIGLVF